MGKNYINVFLFIFLNSLLFSSEKKWINRKEFQLTVQGLIRKCINHEKRLQQEGKSSEEAGSLVLKNHDSRRLYKLRKQNPHFLEIIELELKKTEQLL